MTHVDLSRCAVAGLGVTGRAVANALIDRGSQVVLMDDKPSATTEFGLATGLEVCDSSNSADLEIALSGVTALSIGPGISAHHNIYRIAASKGLPVVSELDLAAMWDSRPCAAITGTNGKTTVTDLVTKMLLQSNIEAVAAGNTDIPLVEALSIRDPTPEVFVVEASSFRLHNVELFRPRVAAWLNFAPDHLDWHGNLESYANSKKKIWEQQEAGDLTVLPYEDEFINSLYKGAASQLLTFGPGGDVSVQGSHIVDRGEKIVAIEKMPLGRPHDLLNACAAVAVAREMGAKVRAVESVLINFSGLSHRLEFVTKTGGVNFFNDSKATTPHATVAALKGFENAVLIVGGRNKAIEFTPLLGAIANLGAVVCIGETADLLVSLFSPYVPALRATSMKEAVNVAAAMAQDLSGSVLLSPACASFDWYSGYEARGDDFKKAVKQVSLGEGQDD
jgi:UDP-N-acetylmuramoylalanine--D-glutamate ligase